MIIRILQKTFKCRVRPLWPSASTVRIGCAADGHKGRTLQEVLSLAKFLIPKLLQDFSVDCG